VHVHYAAMSFPDITRPAWSSSVADCEADNRRAGKLNCSVNRISILDCVGETTTESFGELNDRQPDTGEYMDEDTRGRVGRRSDCRLLS